MLPQLSISTTGDFNQDGTVDSNDIPAMLAALTDVPAYMSALAVNNTQLNQIADINTDGFFNNRDIQPMLDKIINNGGFGSVATVPEPSSVALLAIGGVALAIHRRRRRT